MNRIGPIGFTVLGIALVIAGILIKKHRLLDQIANLSFSYLAGMLGLAVLVVGIHCVAFGSIPSELALLPNIVLFVIIAGASNINIVWDGIVFGHDKNDIWLNLSNSLEFSIY